MHNESSGNSLVEFLDSLIVENGVRSVNAVYCADGNCQHINACCLIELNSCVNVSVNSAGGVCMTGNVADLSLKSYVCLSADFLDLVCESYVLFKGLHGSVEHNGASAVLDST